MHKSLNQPQTKQTPSSKSYILHLYSIQFSPAIMQRYKAISFAVYGEGEAVVRESPVLRGDSRDVWEIGVNSGRPVLVFFVELGGQGTRNREELARVVLEVNRFDKAVYMNGQLFCHLRYELQIKPHNRFHNNSNIFDDPSEQPLRVPRRVHAPNLDLTYQRKAFYEPDSKIIEQSSEQREQREDERTVMKKVEEASRALEESLRRSEEERKIFSKYLDDSTSYINQLMHHLEEKPVLDTSKILDISEIREEGESEEELGTQQKWYQRKFHKNYIKQKSQLKRKKLKNLKLSQEPPKKITLKFSPYPQQPLNSPTKMLSNIILDTKQKPTLIILSYEDQNKTAHPLVQMTKEDGAGSSSWPVQISLPGGYPLNIGCRFGKGDGLGEELLGCVGKDEEMLGCCEMFDALGVVKGMAYFKCKEVNESIIQTHERLPEQNQQPVQLNSTSLQQSSKPIQQQPSQDLNSPIFSKQITKSEYPTSPSPSQNLISPIRLLQMGTSLDTDHFVLEGQGKKQEEQEDSKLNRANKEEEEPLYYLPRSHTMKETSNAYKLDPQNSDEQNTKQPNKKKIKLNFDNLNNKQDQIPKSSRLHESQAISLFSSRTKKINLKLTNIDVRLQQPNHTGKFLKMELSGQALPYYTETSKQLYFLNWKGKGYLFIGVPKTSILTLSLMEAHQSNQGQGKLVSKCRVHLNLLDVRHQGLNSYEDYLRDQNEEAIGKVVLEFQFFDKKTKVGELNSNLNSPRRPTNTDTPQQQSTRYKETSSRLFQSQTGKKSTVSNPNPLQQSSRMRIKSQQKRSHLSPSRNIELHERVFDQISRESNNKKTLKIRRYVGGNIIIPKAPRFKTEPDGGRVGPGAYEYESQFQRHAVQEQ